MTRLVRARGTPLWLVLYALGLVCVFSFVFFEILDVDGSDFQPAPARVSIKLAEASHESFRRISLIGGAPALTPALDVARIAPPTPTVRDPREGPRQTPILARLTRGMLPRALLPAVPPSS